MDEVTIAVATAVAGKVAEGLTQGGRELLKKLRAALFARFGDEPAAQAALNAALVDNEDERAIRELAGHVAAAEAADPQVKALTDQLRSELTAGRDAVVNTVNGDIGGSATVIQGRDMDFGPGGLHIGR